MNNEAVNTISWLAKRVKQFWLTVLGVLLAPLYQALHEYVLSIYTLYGSIILTVVITTSVLIVIISIFYGRPSLRKAETEAGWQNPLFNIYNNNTMRQSEKQAAPSGDNVSSERNIAMRQPMVYNGKGCPRIWLSVMEHYLETQQCPSDKWSVNVLSFIDSNVTAKLAGDPTRFLRPDGGFECLKEALITSQQIIHKMKW